MEITLQERTADHVRIYFERTQDDQIDQMLPRSVPLPLPTTSLPSVCWRKTVFL